MLFPFYSPRQVTVRSPSPSLTHHHMHVCVSWGRMFSHYPCKIIYVESIARTRKLSLSGKILYHLRIADLLMVQWQELTTLYPRTKFAGRLY